MTVTIPEAGNDTWFSFRTTFDGRILTCTLYWSESIQHIYDAVVKQVRDDAHNDPIVRNGAYIRDYSLFDYYQVDNPVTSDDMFAEWYGKHKDELTMNLRAIPQLADLKRTVMNRSVTYYGIRRTIDELAEMLVWSFSISDEGDTVTGVIRPGGLYERDGKWAMTIHSDVRTDIGREDLPFVTLEFS